MVDATRTDLANHALDLLGQEDVANIDEPVTDIERKIARNLGAALELSLKQRRWGFAREVRSLAALDESEDRFQFLTRLPVDCLLVWTVNGKSDGWVLRAGSGRGRLAHNGGNPVSLEYTKLLEPHELPTEFLLYCAAELAVLCMRTPTVDLSAAKQDELLRTADDRLVDAAAIHDAQGGETELVPSRYIDQLYGFGSRSASCHPWPGEGSS